MFWGLGVPRKERKGRGGEDLAVSARSPSDIGNLAYEKGEQGQGCSHLRRTMVLVIEKPGDLRKVGRREQ